MHWYIQFVGNEWNGTRSLWSYKPDMAKVWPAGHMRPFKLFLRPLSLGGLKIFCELHPLKCHFWRKCWLFKPKNDIFEEKFCKLLWFLQICREILKKNLNPSTPWNELGAPRTLQIIENGPWVKKSGHPCTIRLFQFSSHSNYVRSSNFHSNEISKNRFYHNQNRIQVWQIQYLIERGKLTFGWKIPFFIFLFFNKNFFDKTEC